jgi:hypothetical protein
MDIYLSRLLPTAGITELKDSSVSGGSSDSTRDSNIAVVGVCTSFGDLERTVDGDCIVSSILIGRLVADDDVEPNAADDVFGADSRSAE